MKTFYLAIIFVFIVHTVFGQASKTTNPGINQVSKEELIAIKSRPLIICQTGRPQVDKDIEALVKKIWSFNSEVLFYNNAQIKEKLAANGAGYSILSFEVVDFVLTGKVPEGANGWVRVSLKAVGKIQQTETGIFSGYLRWLI